MERLLGSLRQEIPRGVWPGMLYSSLVLISYIDFVIMTKDGGSSSIWTGQGNIHKLMENYKEIYLII